MRVGSGSAIVVVFWFLLLLLLLLKFGCCSYRLCLPEMFSIFIFHCCFGVHQFSVFFDATYFVLTHFQRRSKVGKDFRGSQFRGDKFLCRCANFDIQCSGVFWGVV